MKTDTDALYVLNNAGGQLGWFRATWPFFEWKLFSDCIYVSVWMISSGTVLIAEIERIEEKSYFGTKVWHRSPRVVSPIVFRDEKLSKLLIELFKNK